MPRIAVTKAGLLLLAALVIGACGGPAAGEDQGAMAPVVVGPENLAMAKAIWSKK